MRVHRYKVSEGYRSHCINFVSVMEKVNSNKKKRLYLRYQEEELDYLIVFEKKSEKRVQLITAYPVFFVSAKKDYEKDYQNYIKEIEKETK